MWVCVCVCVSASMVIVTGPYVNGLWPLNWPSQDAQPPKNSQLYDGYDGVAAGYLRGRNHSAGVGRGLCTGEVLRRGQLRGHHRGGEGAQKSQSSCCYVVVFVCCCYCFKYVYLFDLFDLFGAFTLSTVSWFWLVFAFPGDGGETENMWRYHHTAAGKRPEGWIEFACETPHWQLCWTVCAQSASIEISRRLQEFRWQPSLPVVTRSHGMFGLGANLATSGQTTYQGI